MGRNINKIYYTETFTQDEIGDETIGSTLCEVINDKVNASTQIVEETLYVNSDVKDESEQNALYHPTSGQSSICQLTRKWN